MCWNNLRCAAWLALLLLSGPGGGAARHLLESGWIEGEVLACREGIVTLRHSPGDSIALIALERFAEAQQVAILERFPGGGGNTTAEAAPGQGAEHGKPPPVATAQAEPGGTPSAARPRPRVPGERPALSSPPPGMERTRKCAVGDKPPELSAQIQGTPEAVTLEELRGRLVLVVFMATWQPGVERDVKALRALYQEYNPLGLEVLGVCLDTNRKRLNAFEEQHGVVWPVAFDRHRRQAERWGVDTLPTFVLIDQVGRIAAVTTSRKELESQIRPYLKRR